MDRLKFLRTRKKLTFILVPLAVFAIAIFPVSKLATEAFATEGTNGSTIGGVNISGLKEDEMRAALEQAIEKWAEKPIVVTGGGMEIEFDASEIPFDINATIEKYHNLTDQPFYLFWKPEKVVKLPIHISESEYIKNLISNVPIWNEEDTYYQIINQASYLLSHEVEAKVQDYSLMENERIAFTIEKIPASASGVSEVAKTLEEYILYPNEPFSFIAHLGNAAELANGDGLNFIGSVIYQTVLHANIDILERHSQNQIPSYLEPGMDVRIDRFNERDLQFVNVSKRPIILKASVDGDSLKVELFSHVKDADVKVHISKDTIAPRVINRYSKDLPIGRTQLIQEGKPGLRITVKRTISENGDLKEQEISKDYYPPTNRIVLNSSRTPSSSSVGSGTTPPKKVENVDLDGDGLPDYDDTNDISDQELEEKNSKLPPGSYYDKGGNLITP